MKKKMIFIDLHIHLIQSFSCRECWSFQICFYNRNGSQNLEFLQNIPVPTGMPGLSLRVYAQCAASVATALELLKDCASLVFSQEKQLLFITQCVCLLVLILYLFFLALRVDLYECLLDTK